MSYKVLRWRLSLQKKKAERSLIKEGYTYKKFLKKERQKEKESVVSDSQHSLCRLTTAQTWSEALWKMIASATVLNSTQKHALIVISVRRGPNMLIWGMFSCSDLSDWMSVTGGWTQRCPRASLWGQRGTVKDQTLASGRPAWFDKV